MFGGYDVFVLVIVFLAISWTRCTLLHCKLGLSTIPI